MPRKFAYYNRLKRPKLEYPENTENYIDYTVHQEKKSTGSGVDDFEIIDVVEEHKTNIKEFINSYNDKAGIDSVIRIFEATGDASLFNQVEALHADLTIIPDDPEQAFNLANGGAKIAFDKLDKELVGDQDMETFIRNLTPEQLKAYIDKKVKEKLENENNETTK